MKIEIAEDLNCIGEVVEIHLATFKGFFLTFLGKDFLKLLYTGFINHNKSNLIVAYDENEIVGFLAYSEDMSSFYKYLIKNKLFAFGWCAFKAFLRKPSIIYRLLSAFGKSDEVKRNENYIELSSIGVKPNKKGQHIGSQMIDYLKGNIDFNVFSYISLETDAVDNEYANRFYLRNNFNLFNTYSTKEGRKMNEYHFRKKNENTIY